jgi:hypothetical protein
LKHLASRLKEDVPAVKPRDGPQRESFRLRLEALDRLDDEELRIVEEVVDGILLKHDAKRWTRTA